MVPELKPGARLGHFTILERIGAGGMGEVYRARDTRLERVVAIKVLPAHMAENAALRQRLEREAKVLAAIHAHPGLTTRDLVPHVYQDVDPQRYDLAERLASRGYQPIVLKGGMGAKARTAAVARLHRTDGEGPEGPLLAVATGSFVGEGLTLPSSTPSSSKVTVCGGAFC